MTNFNAPGNAAWIQYDRQPPAGAPTRRMQVYQWNPERIGRGADHWQQFVGKARATRVDFYQSLIDRYGLRVLAPWGKPFGAPAGQAMAVQPWIQHNRWVATCECGGQEIVDPDDPFFFCWGCNNASADGKPRPVMFGQVEADAEQIMMSRRPENRIWDRHGVLLGRPETLANLVQENRDHNHAVPAEIAARASRDGD